MIPKPHPLRLAAAMLVALLALVAAPPAASASMRPELVLQTGHSDVVSAVAVGLDGRLFATGGRDHLVKIWDARTGACLWTLAGHADEVRYLGFGPDARYLVSVGSAGSNMARDVRLWDVAAGREVLHLADQGSGAFLKGLDGHDLPFSPDGRRLAVPFRDRPLVVSLETMSVAEVPRMTDVLRAAWSGDGRRLALLRFGAATIFDAASLERIAEVPFETPNHSEVASALALDATGDRVVVVERGPRISLRDVASGREVWQAALPVGASPDDLSPSSLRAVAIRETEGQVVGVTYSAALAWDLSDGRARYTIPLEPRRGDVALSLDWRSLAVIADRPDRRPGDPPRPDTIAIWDLQSGLPVRTVAAAEVGYAMGIAGEAHLLVSDAILREPSTYLNVRYFAVWDTASGEMRHLSVGHVYASNAVAWSPDGRSIAVGDRLRIWDLRTGAAFSPPTTSPLARTAAAVTSDLTATSMVIDGALWVWTNTRRRKGDPWKPARRITIGVDAAAMTATALFPGRLVATGGRDGEVRTWDATTGAALQTFAGAGSEITSLAFDEDGRALAAGGRDGRVVVWDLSEGSEVARLDASRTPVRLVRFAGASLYAVTGDGWLRSWRTGLWSEVGASRVGDSVSIAVPRPNEPIVATGDFDGRVRLVDLATGKVTAEVRPSSERVTSIAFHASGPDEADFGALSIGMHDTAAVWTPARGELVVLPASFAWPVSTLAFRPDGRQLLAGMQLVDTQSWEASASSVTSERFQSAAYSPSGEAIAAQGLEGLRLLDVTGKKTGDLPGHLPIVDAVAFGPDGRTLACASRTNTASKDTTAGAADRYEVRVFRLGGEPSSLVLARPVEHVTTLAYTRDGRLVTGDAGGELRVWNVDARRTLATATVPDRAPIRGAVVSPDGLTLAVSSGDVVTLRELPSLEPVRTLAGHADAVGALAYSPDGRMLLSGSKDGTARLWDVATGEHLATLVSSLDGVEWLVVTPDGLFDGSPGAWSRIRWRFGGPDKTAQLAPVEAFFADFYHPGLLAELAAGGRPKAKRDIAALDRRQPDVAMRLAAGTSDATVSGDVAVEIDVAEAPPDADRPQGSGARDVRLFRNGALVRAWRGDVLSGASAPRVTLRTTIPVVSGENRLTAYAFNRDNVKSPDVSIELTGAPRPARARVAHVVVAGVSDYENRAFDLRFAADDARDFAKETRQRLEATGAFSRVDVVSLVDDRATKAGILDALGQLASVGPEDAVFVFFAGHGVARGDRFYLVPHDLGYDGPRDRLDAEALDRIAAHAISDRDLERAFERVDAGHTLLVVDTCFAGRVLGDPDVRTGPLNTRGLAQLAYEKGMYVLAAAEGYQRAVEASSLGHGVLTYALVEEGLKRADADAEPEDGRLMLGEWLDYAARRVPRLHDRLTREDTGASREIVHESAWDRALQTPRLFYRPRGPLVVATYGSKD